MSPSEEISKLKIQLAAANMGWDALRHLNAIYKKDIEALEAKCNPDLIASERAANAILTEENELLRNGPKGDYDLDAWLGWAKESLHLRAEVVRLEKEVQRRNDRAMEMIREMTKLTIMF